MAKSKPKALTQTQSLGGGLVLDSADRSLSIAPHHLEAAQNFFCADHFRLKAVGSSLEILFGQVNTFSEAKQLTLTVQISFPLQNALLAFYEMVWLKPGSSGLVPFSQSLKSSVDLNCERFGPGLKNTLYEGYQLPTASQTRKFAANFATCAYSNGEASIDFYMASPQLIHYALNHGSVRPNDRIQNIFAVVIPIELLLEFVEACKSVLAQFSNEGKTSELV